MRSYAITIQYFIDANDVSYEEAAQTAFNRLTKADSLTLDVLEETSGERRPVRAVKQTDSADEDAMDTALCVMHAVVEDMMDSDWWMRNFQGSGGVRDLVVAISPLVSKTYDHVKEKFGYDAPFDVEFCPAIAKAIRETGLNTWGAIDLATLIAVAEEHIIKKPNVGTPLPYYYADDTATTTGRTFTGTDAMFFRPRPMNITTTSFTAGQVAGLAQEQRERLMREEATTARLRTTLSEMERRLLFGPES